MDYTMGPGGHAWMNSTVAEELSGVYAGVKWIQVTTAILSILGSGSIIGYAVFHNVVRSSEIRPLFYLSLSDLLLALCWLLGAILYKPCSRDSSCYNCYNLQAVGQMFYVSTFFYTLNYTWQTFINMRRKLDSKLYKISERECCIGRVTTILSSVIPILFTMPVLVIGNIFTCYGNSSHSCLVLNVGSAVTADPHNYSDVCRGLHTYSTALFLLTFCLSAIPILVIIGRSQSVLQRHLAAAGILPDHQWAGIKVLSWSLLLFPAIFFFCRLPAVLLALLKLLGNEGTHTFYIILYFIQALTAVSPGFINFLAYGGTRKMLWHLKQRGFRHVDTQTPLLRSQKKLYASMQNSAGDIKPHNVSVF